jgi:hypothetical protein
MHQACLQYAIWYIVFMLFILFLCFTLGFDGGSINCDRGSTSTVTAAAVMGGHSSTCPHTHMHMFTCLPAPPRLPLRYAMPCLPQRHAALASAPHHTSIFVSNNFT